MPCELWRRKCRGNGLRVGGGKNTEHSVVVVHKRLQSTAIAGWLQADGEALQLTYPTVKGLGFTEPLRKAPLSVCINLI